MTAYYNEIDPFAVRWLRNLIDAGLIAPGVVDDRSIEDVTPKDLDGFTQCHFFAGIGVWSYALRNAGWPDDKPVWTGSCPCFPAGTLVLTDRGYFSIEDIRVGDKVLTHRARWRRVTAIGSESSDLLTVKGQGHWGLRVTPDHPFLTGEEEWTNASELAGKRWRTVRSIPHTPAPIWLNYRGVKYDRGKWRATGWKDGRSVYLGRYASKEEAYTRRQQAVMEGEIDVRGADRAVLTDLGFARFLGYWLGDGWTTGQRVYICGSHDQAPLLKEILHGANLPFSPTTERSTVRACVGSKSLVSWLRDNFGSGARSKKIPVWIYSMPEEWRLEFLRGYGEADGHLEGDYQMFTTVSRSIAVGVRVLLNQIRVSASVSWHDTSPTKVIEGRKVKTEGGFYRISAYKKARSFSFNHLHGIGYVRTVEPAGFGQVFNLSVDEDESYTADGIVVHNCQPFSAAGKGAGFADERHLWPAWHWLVEQCLPHVVFGEQVARKAGLAWLDLVSTDLEGAGYTVGAAVTAACGFGAPHIRQRLYWVADAEDYGRERIEGAAWEARRDSAALSGRPGGVGDTDSERRNGEYTLHVKGKEVPQTPWAGETGGLADADSRQCDGRTKHGGVLVDGANGRRAEADCEPERDRETGRPGPTNGYWRDADWLYCTDHKWRPVEPESFPLVDRSPGRVGQIRAYGNAIVAPQAQAFIEAYIEERSTGLD